MHNNTAKPRTIDFSQKVVIFTEFALNLSFFVHFTKLPFKFLVRKLTFWLNINARNYSVWKRPFIFNDIFWNDLEDKYIYSQFIVHIWQ